MQQLLYLRGRVHLDNEAIHFCFKIAPSRQDRNLVHAFRSRCRVFYHQYEHTRVRCCHAVLHLTRLDLVGPIWPIVRRHLRRYERRGSNSITRHAILEPGRRLQLLEFGMAAIRLKHIKPPVDKTRPMSDQPYWFISLFIFLSRHYKNKHINMRVNELIKGIPVPANYCRRSAIWPVGWMIPPRIQFQDWRAVQHEYTVYNFFFFAAAAQ